jgi:hypothetical protein
MQCDVDQECRKEDAMKTTVATLSILLAITVFASLNHAATEQLIVDHFLTGYTRGSSSVTLDYRLHVVNPGAGRFFNLSLALDPLPPLISAGTGVAVGYLGPHEAGDVALHLVTPVTTDPEQFVRNGLFWKGRYEDLDGKQVEFPVKSTFGPLAKK